MMIMKMLMMVAKSKTVKMMMVTGVWEDNDPSLSVRCKAEGRPRALPRVEVAQVGNMMMMMVNHESSDDDVDTMMTVALMVTMVKSIICSPGGFRQLC